MANRAVSMAQEAGFPGSPDFFSFGSPGSMMWKRNKRLHEESTARALEALESAASQLPQSEDAIRAWHSAGRGQGPPMQSVGGRAADSGSFGFASGQHGYKSGQPFASYLQLLSQRREAGIDPFDFSAAMPAGRGAGAVATPEAAEQTRLDRGGRGTGLLAAGSATGGFTGVPSRGAERGAPSRFATDARAAEQRRIGSRTAGGSESRGRGRGAKLTSALGVPGRGKTLLG